MCQNSKNFPFHLNSSRFILYKFFYGTAKLNNEIRKSLIFKAINDKHHVKDEIGWSRDPSEYRIEPESNKMRSFEKRKILGNLGIVSILIKAKCVLVSV